MYLIEGPEAAQGVVQTARLALATGSRVGVVASEETIAQAASVDTTNLS